MPNKEINFIIDCLRSYPKTNEIPTDIYSKYNLDWEKVTRLAIKHKVIPQTYPILKLTNAPNTIIDKIKKYLVTYNKEVTLIENELFKITDILNNKSIEHIVIKGYELAKNYYKQINEREFSDIDLLIKKENLASINNILLKLGYNPKKKLTKKQHISELKSQYSVTYINKKTNLEIDLHWHVAQIQFRYKFNQTILFNSYQKKEINNLSPENNLLFLSIHGAKENWDQLKLLLDLKMIISNQNLDWDYIIRTANEFHMKQILLISLLSCKTILKVKLPDNIQKLINNNIIRSQVSIITDNISNNVELNEWEAFCFQLKIRDKIINKIKFIYYNLSIPHEEDWEIIKIPDSLFFLYYIFKPLKTIYKAINKVFN